MTYEELKAAYEAAVQKCSELEKENDELRGYDSNGSFWYYWFCVCCKFK